MALPDPIYTSGDFSQITPIEVPRFSQPFENDAKRYVLTIRCRSFAKHFVPPALNTVFSAAGIVGSSRFNAMFTNEGFLPSEFYLVRLGTPTPIGIELEYDLTFAAIPSQRQEPTQFNFTYPGWITPTGTTRDPKTEIVNQAIIVHDYFLVGSTATPTLLRVPVLTPFKVFLRFGTFTNGTPNDSYPNPLITANNNQTLTAPAYDTPNVVIGGVTYPSYFPFLESYKNKIKNNQPILLTDMLIAQANAPQLWLGNIVDRTTIYVPPQ